MGLIWAIYFLTLQFDDSHASLGGPLSSIQADRQALLGKKEKFASKSAQNAKNVQNANLEKSYSVHEIQLSGRSIREYLSSNGIVFAVTWRGVSQPDLSVLLGSYFPEYKAATAQLRNQRRGTPQVIRSKKVVVEKSGHMRDVRGKAYLPEFVPVGFDVAEID